MKTKMKTLPAIKKIIANWIPMIQINPRVMDQIKRDLDELMLGRMRRSEKEDEVWEALSRDDVEALKKAKQEKINFKTIQKGKMNALITAFVEGKMKSVKWLLNEVNLNEQEKNNQFNILMLACQSTNGQGLAEELIQRGVDLNQQNKEGWTALMFACLRKQWSRELIKELIMKGADPDIRTHKKETLSVFLNKKLGLEEARARIEWIQECVDIKNEEEMQKENQLSSTERWRKKRKK